MVDCTGLLSRRAFTGTEGSNPSLSAKLFTTASASPAYNAVTVRKMS